MQSGVNRLPEEKKNTLSERRQTLARIKVREKISENVNVSTVLWEHFKPTFEVVNQLTNATKKLSDLKLWFELFQRAVSSGKFANELNEEWSLFRDAQIEVLDELNIESISHPEDADMRNAYIEAVDYSKEFIYPKFKSANNADSVNNIILENHIKTVATIKKQQRFTSLKAYCCCFFPSARNLEPVEAKTESPNTPLYRGSLNSYS